MKILLSPSETKIEGGKEIFNIENLFLSKELNSKRKELVDRYVNIVTGSNLEAIKKLTGLKQEKQLNSYKQNILKTPTLKAIERYSGVAFDYIDYNSLNENAKRYIDENVLIFSNLFGVLKANDLIPLYKIKQGEALDSIKVENEYKKLLKEPLDSYLEDEDILDIRAGYYDKFYKPSKFYTTLKFLKNGKVVSHWAKAYRGIVLNNIAKNSIKTIKEFIAMPIKGLSLIEIRESKKSQELIYEIED